MPHLALPGVRLPPPDYRQVTRFLVRCAVAAVITAAIWSIVFRPWGWMFALGVHPYPAGTPWTYQLWSGFMPALTVLTLFGSVASLYRVHNCHVMRCPRLGKYPVADGAFKVCRQHHPDALVQAGKVTHEHIMRLHRRAR